MARTKINIAGGKARAKFTIKTRKVTRKIQRANAQAMRILANKQTRALQTALDKPFPPPSPGNQPPHRRSGDLQKSAKVRFDGKNRMVVESLDYGGFLEGPGIKTNRPAMPWIRPTLFAPKARVKWNKEYNRLMRRFSG